jgi:hypothetical protein
MPSQNLSSLKRVKGGPVLQVVYSGEDMWMPEVLKPFMALYQLWQW